MNYRKPELIGMLAAEYLVGNLTGRARRRFERVMLDSHAACAVVWCWEARLSGVAEPLARRRATPPDPSGD